MNLRPYQLEFVEKSRDALARYRRVLAVAATGAGKTIMAAELMRRESGNCLFLADAEELIKQNAAKYHAHTGEFAGVERGSSRAVLGTDRVIVATSQTLWRRLENYPQDYFSLIIADEAHRNTLGAMTERILNHFGDYSRVLGVTATPYRADRKKLGDYYENLAVDIGLDRLIREGFLSRIMIKGVPLNIDLSKVRTNGGDYRASDLDAAVDPHLVKAAELLRQTMDEHKRQAAVVFLPLVETSKRFADILCGMGVAAVHADGQDRSALDLFAKGRAKVICNASLLTTGWDCPRVDCVYILRPTKSLALYSQMVGRGTRIHPGKDHLLLLDPLYLHEDHKLITPARLIASDDDGADRLMKKVRAGGLSDLMEEEETRDVDREEGLIKAIDENAKKDARLIDALEFAKEYGGDNDSPEETQGWASQPPTENQRAALAKSGFDMTAITTRGQAAKIIDMIFMRRERNLASPKQLRLLKQLGHPSPASVSFQDAGKWLDEKLNEKGNDRYENTAPITARTMVALRARGINPKTVKSQAEAESLLSAK